LYFDCFCGASGDMIVGALIDAGADFAAVREALLSLPVSGFTVSAEKVRKHGIVATQFSVHVDGHGHPHRHLADVVRIIEDADLPASVRTASVATFQRIAECEAAVHGTSIDEVHFHEVGAVDSIADIVGAHVALHALGAERILASPLHVGSGTVKTEHGVLPVPAPATALLLEGASCYGGEIHGELVTPTGAALITQCAAAYGPIPMMQIDAIGYGSGTRDWADRANVLRVLVGRTGDAAAEMETVAILEANIDDMNPELLPPLIAELIAQGARDAFLTPILGKKGRPGFLITVLCDEAKAAGLAPILFHGSTTLGVRLRTERRLCLAREWKSVQTPWGDVRIKVGRFGGAVTCASPEFEDCRRVAETGGVPVRAVYDAAHAAAVKKEWKDA
jgi:uncharacterized protein (TIGR00299 family) protein